MAHIDSKVAAVLDKGPAGAAAAADNDHDEDALIDALEDDPEVDAYREQRLQQLHEEYTRAKQMRGNEHGGYAEIKDEKALMDLTTSTKLCIVHFFKPDFNRCRIMDGHLDTLAPKHLDTRFLKINVENAPFLVVKLKVQVLPCVIGFVDGIGTDRVVGFEGLGRGTDSFTTQDLEARFVGSGVLLRSKTANDPATRFHRPSKSRRQAQDEDDEDEWD